MLHYRKNGCLRVFPGSHTAGYLEYRVSNGESLSGSGQPLELVGAPPPENGILVPLQPGEAALFSVCLVHDSGANRSLDDRIGLNIRYVAGDAALEAPGGLRPIMMVKGRTETLPTSPFPSWTDEEGLERFLALKG